MRRRGRRPPEGEFSADILDLAEDGRGVARVDGKVVFIADSLPGERVRFRYLATGKAADEGQTVSVESPSPDRVAPGCDHFGLCGGCALQHLSPEASASIGYERSCFRMLWYLPSARESASVSQGANASWLRWILFQNQQPALYVCQASG